MCFLVLNYLRPAHDDYCQTFRQLVSLTFQSADILKSITFYLDSELSVRWQFIHFLKYVPDFNSIDLGSGTCLVSLDFGAAFDTIAHSILLAQYITCKLRYIQHLALSGSVTTCLFIISSFASILPGQLVPPAVWVCPKVLSLVLSFFHLFITYDLYSYLLWYHGTTVRWFHAVISYHLPFASGRYNFSTQGVPIWFASLNLA